MTHTTDVGAILWYFAYFCQKLVAMVTPLCSLRTGESQMNSLIAQTLSENKPCMDMLHTTEVMAIFVIFWPILAKIWWPWQRPLEPCNQKCLLWIGRPRKPPVISNRILVISRRNAFICIYSNFSPKIGCRGNASLSLVYGSVTDEFPDGTNLISKPNSVSLWRIQLKLWPFCDIFAYFGQNLVAMATSRRPLQSEMSFLEWSTT